MKKFMKYKNAIRIWVLICLVMWVISLFNLKFIEKELSLGIREYIFNMPLWIICCIQIMVGGSWYTYLYKSEYFSVKLFIIVAFVFVVSMFLFILTFFSKYQFVMVLTVLVWLFFVFFEKRNKRLGYIPEQK